MAISSSLFPPPRNLSRVLKRGCETCVGGVEGVAGAKEEITVEAERMVEAEEMEIMVLGPTGDYLRVGLGG